MNSGRDACSLREIYAFIVWVKKIRFLTLQHIFIIDLGQNLWAKRFDRLGIRTFVVRTTNLTNCAVWRPEGFWARFWHFKGLYRIPRTNNMSKNILYFYRIFWAFRWIQNYLIILFLTGVRAILVKQTEIWGDLPGFSGVSSALRYPNKSAISSENFEGFDIRVEAWKKSIRHSLCTHTQIYTKAPGVSLYFISNFLFSRF